MHRLAVGALAGLGLLVGCLGEKTQQCRNGATCPFDEACTEVPLTSGLELCGSPGLVTACQDKPDFTVCTFAEPDTLGTCFGKRCAQCSTDLAGCQYPGWRSMTSATSERLRAISVSGPSEAYAVGDHRTVMIYDGLRWRASQLEDPSTTPISQDAPLNSVWGDGTTLYATTNDSMGRVFAGQRDGDGVSWSVALSGAFVNAISGSGPNDIVAVGPNGTIIQYDGVIWTPVMVPGVTLPLRGVYVVDSQSAWAVGNQGLVLRRQAGAWSISRMNVIGEKNLNSVWGTADTAFAASDTPDFISARVLQFDADTWSTANLPAGAGVNLLSIWGADNQVFAAGNSGTLLHFNGAEWTLLPSPTGQTNINALHGSATDNVIYVGESGVVGRYTGVE